MYKILKIIVLYSWAYIFTNILHAQTISMVFRGDADLYEKDIVCDEEGNTYLLCGRNTGPLEEDVLVIALNNQQNLRWSKRIFSSSLLRPGFIKVMSDGNILVVMDDFADGANLGGSNVTIGKLGPDGNVLSTFRIGSILYEEIDDVIFLENGNMLFVGNMAASSGYGVFLVEVNNQEIISTQTFQIGLYDYITQVYTYDEKIYLFGTTYFFPGPAQPVLIELDSARLPSRTWVFSCPDVQGSAGALLADETGFQIEVSCDDRAVFFRFEDGIMTTSPKDYGYGFISKIHSYMGQKYFFNGKEYSLRKNQEKKYHVGTEKAGMTKMSFFKDRWTGIGSVKENNIYTIHLASDHVLPQEDCGSYAFGSLPPLVDKNINVLTPAYQTFSAPLIQFSMISDIYVTDASLQTNILCSRVSAQDQIADRFQVLPNPANEWISIPLGEDYKLLNAQGQIISEGQSDGKVNVFYLPSGTYFLNFRGKFYKFFRI